MMPLPSAQASSVFGSALSWLGSAVTAALILSGVGAWVLAPALPGESRGEVLAPMVLTLAAPDAVQALPTPPPEVSANAPAPIRPSQVLPANTLPALPDPVADHPIARPVLPQLPSPLSAPDLPVPTDAAMSPALPRPDKQRPQSRPEQKPAAPEPNSDIVKPARKTQPAFQSASMAGDAGKTVKATHNDGIKASSATTQNLQHRWGSVIRKRIEAHKSYPSAAQEMQGTVEIRLTVARAGQLTAVGVVRSSGQVILDRAAAQAVKSAAKFPAAPAGLTEPSYSFTIPITFAN